MSSSPAFPPPPTKKRNTKGLKLTAESLAPPPLDSNDDDDDDGHNQLYRQPLGTLPAAVPISSSSSSSSSSAAAAAATSHTPQLVIPKSSVSKKKPAGLSIARSIPTRAAPPQPDIETNGVIPDSLQKLSPSPSSSRQTYHSKLSEQLATLDISRKPTKKRSTREAPNGKGRGKGKDEDDQEQFSIRPEDLKVIGDLGAGSGGTVNKVIHQSTGLIMAKKLVLIDAKPSIRKQILRELQIMHDCSSPWIVSFYGAFLADPHICICMEHMDLGSLDNIYRRYGPVDINIIGKIAEAVLEGLTYLYDVHRIIHRDIKPSNILVNSKGEVKICDFGVSGELINSIANTFVGTSTYMSPERIQGANYTVKSDVWSLGITLIELALGRFPFSSDDATESDDDSDLREMTQRGSHFADDDRTAQGGSIPPKLAIPTSKAEKRKSKGVSLGGGGMTMSILDLLQHIVNEPAPRLIANAQGVRFPSDAEDFVERCLQKDPEKRANPKDLLVHPWIIRIKASEVDLIAWTASLA